MTLDFNKPFTGTKGEILASEGGQYQILARLLGSSNTGDPIKMWGWAKQLMSGGAIDVEPNDCVFLEKFVRETPLATVMCKAQLLETILEIRT